MTEFVSHTRCVWATSSEASPFNAVVLINSSRPFTPYIFAAIDTIERKHIFNITQKHWTGFLHFTVRWPESVACKAVYRYVYVQRKIVCQLVNSDTGACEVPIL